jgi:PBP1b-binding outer membrane lipoprotein LpoB
MKTRRTKKMMKLISLFLMVMILSSCSLFHTGYEFVNDNFDIKIKGTQDKNAKIVDSMLIKFEPVYWEEEIEIDSIEKYGDAKTEFRLNGYSVWILETEKIRYSEVKKLDTVIYFIRK